MKQHLKEILITIICLAATICYIWIAVHRPISYDDSYNASMAKNLVSGFGYATSYQQLIKFNPEITTGPALLLPTAATIYFFGNQYWVPGVTNAVISGILLWLLCLLLVKKIPKSYSGASIAALIAGEIILLFAAIDNSGVFSSCIGEAGAVLTYAIGTLLLVDTFDKPTSTNKKKVQQRVVGCIFLGLSLLFKYIIIFQIFATACILVGIAWRRSGWRKTVKQGWVYFLVVFLPLATFLLFKANTSGMAGEEQFVLYHDGVSGFATLLHIFLAADFSLLWHNIGMHFIQLLEVFSTFWNLLLLIILLITTFAILRQHKKHYTTQQLIAWCLLTSGAIGFFWWLLLSAGWYRHVLPSVMVLLIGLVVTQMLISSKREFIFFTAAIWLLIALLHLPITKPISDSAADEITAQQNTTNFIHNLQITYGDNVVFYGCGWWANRDLEYLLPTTLNFRNCLRDNILQTTDKPNAVKILVRNKRVWNWEHNPALDYVSAACENNKVLFTNANYVISQCLPRITNNQGTKHE